MSKHLKWDSHVEWKFYIPENKHNMKPTNPQKNTEQKKVEKSKSIFKNQFEIFFNDKLLFPHKSGKIYTQTQDSTYIIEFSHDIWTSLLDDFRKYFMLVFGGYGIKAYDDVLAVFKKHDFQTFAKGILDRKSILKLYNDWGFTFIYYTTNTLSLLNIDRNQFMTALILYTTSFRIQNFIKRIENSDSRQDLVNKLSIG